LHAGLDFGIPVGTPVRSVADGVVVEVLRERGGYGVSVRVQHPDGTLSLYAHLSEVLADLGPVRAGDVIALSGNSGSSTGPHLHFELRGPQGPFDARPWLAARGVVV
jgi:murein DD-endopeptidase MepM/ murein hydrolase activator NlpD